jgi:acyl carrier protein
VTIESDLRELVLRKWTDSPDQLTEDYPLIEAGVVDSLTINEIASMAENQYGVAIDDEDFAPDNFETLDAMARLIRAKQSA